MSDFLFSGTTLLAASGEGGHHGVSFWGLIFYEVLTLGIIFGLLAVAKKDFTKRVFKNPIAQATEQLYLFIENMCVGIIGAHGRKYIPMIMVFWMVIFVGNITALFFPAALTADISFNLALALVAIAYVQWEGIRTNGLFGHLSHFSGPKLGGIMVLISAMIFVIEIISEVMKNVSLTLRLYGNIEGGHQAGDAMTKLGEEWLIPVGAFLMPIKLLTCVVQALIFTLLTCVYLSLVTHHDHEEHHEEQVPTPSQQEGGVLTPPTSEAADPADRHEHPAKA
jgi:F-type H+-transporting ATPase subunit a